MLEWILVNLFVPVLAPVACVGLLKFVKNDISIKKILRDGQMGWVAVCFAASAKYELGLIDPTPDWEKAAEWVVIIFIVMTSILTAGATIYPFDEKSEENKVWYNKFRVMLATGIATVVCAIMYGTIHSMLPS